MTKLSELHERWSQDPEYRAAYEALGPEFELAESLIRARAQARLSQADVAARMGTTQSVVARLESGRVMPSTRTLRRYAEATGCRLKMVLVPNTPGASDDKPHSPAQDRTHTS